jgi:hypothetical protein
MLGEILCARTSTLTWRKPKDFSAAAGLPRGYELSQFGIFVPSVPVTEKVWRKNGLALTLMNA